MKVRELKDALVDVDDELEVQVPGRGYLPWVDGEWTDVETDKIGTMTSSPVTVQVFRIGAADS